MKNPLLMLFSIGYQLIGDSIGFSTYLDYSGPTLEKFELVMILDLSKKDSIIKSRKPQYPKFITHQTSVESRYQYQKLLKCDKVLIL